MDPLHWPGQPIPKTNGVRLNQSLSWLSRRLQKLTCLSQWRIHTAPRLPPAYFVPEDLLLVALPSLIIRTPSCCLSSSPHTGLVYEHHVTGLCRSMQESVEKAVRRSQDAGFMSTRVKPRHYLQDPQLFNSSRPVKSNPY